MNFLAGVPYLPPHSATAGGSWTAFFVLIVVLAIVAGVLLALGNRGAGSRPAASPRPSDADTDRRAA